MSRPTIGSRYTKPTFYVSDPDMERVQKGVLKPGRGLLRPWRINWWLVGAAVLVAFTIILPLTA